jgi:uncharacterized protein (DUF1697 family)
MSTYVLLLRAVNVAGRNTVRMAVLKELLEQLGFKEIQTLLQSGNAVFRGPRQSSATIERKIESDMQESLGLTVDSLVRTAAECQAILKRNPFSREAKTDPGHLVVLFLKSAVEADQVCALQEAIAGRECVKGDGRELFVTYPDGIGRSKLTNTLIERILGVRVTGRNWNTMQKLAGLAGGEAP